MAYKDIKPYANLVHEARKHGGTDLFIKDIEKSGILKGQKIGRLKGLKEGFGIGGITVWFIIGSIVYGKRKWDQHKSKTNEERKEEITK